jgi:hypothetical protein
MVWAAGPALRLCFPVQLLDRLDPEQRRTLLAHELAHVRRRDHWLRVLELGVLGVYWWFPVAWWARQELREAEEQCCDAWVVWALAGMERAYALALVHTVAFLSGVRPALPLGASGIGHVAHLRKRLTMVMAGRTPRMLSWVGCLAVLGLGLPLLAILPVQGQPLSPQSSSAQFVSEDPGEGSPGDEQQKRNADQKAGSAEVEKARAEVEQLKAFLTRRRAEFQAQLEALKAMFAEKLENLEASYERARNHLKALEGKADRRDEAVVPKEVEGLIKAIDTQSGYVTITPGSDAGLQVGNILHVYRLRPEARYLGTIRIVNLNAQEAVGRPVGPLRHGLIKVGDHISGRFQQGQAEPTEVFDRSRGGGSSSAPRGPSRQSNELEQKLDRLQKEVEELRRELLRQGRSKTGDAHARVLRAEAEVATFRDRFSWSERMQKIGNVTESEVRAAGLRLKAAEAALDAARQDLDGLMTDLKVAPPNDGKPGKQ